MEILSYVERYGTAARHRLPDVISLAADEFEGELDRLTDRGYLEDDGAILRVALGVSSTGRHTRPTTAKSSSCGPPAGTTSWASSTPSAA